MKERALNLKAWEVRAILEGRKSQFRRVMKPQPRGLFPKSWFEHCPFGQIGDRFWCRETSQYADWTEDGCPKVRYAADGTMKWCEEGFSEEQAEQLLDIWASLSVDENYSIDNRAADRRWRSSTQMPRWASRILLEVTDVRVERLQEISDEDALDEGVYPTKTGLHVGSPRAAYRELWESIHGPGSWDANPFVWAVSFRRIEDVK